ncbi:VWA domain-containing protein [Chloroflexota bacterium]
MMKRIIREKYGLYLTLVTMVSLFMVFGSGCGTGATSTQDSQSDRSNTGTSRSTERDYSGMGEEEEEECSTESAQSYTPRNGSSSSTVGLAVGGAKDVNNFRENINNDYSPLPTDISYEGLFYDYYFDTEEDTECRKLFCPSYSLAIAPDPFSGKPDYYLSVGLNSGLQERDFQRKKLNLVIVLDISSSMRGEFDRYYYDRFGNEIDVGYDKMNRKKIEVALESVISIIDHLDEDDRFGLVLFNGSARLAEPLVRMDYANINRLKDRIRKITTSGSTRLSAGMQMATGLYEDLPYYDPSEYENRIIFLTDAMPNQGDTSKTGLLGMAENNADNRIHTTFIGIGVDFNTELVDYITRIRGANYYSVQYAKQFRERMENEFEHMVTPLVFNLQLTLHARGWDILKVYGSPEADEATGELMKVNTLFPSEKKGGETRGGIVLLKLKRTGSGHSLRLRTSYEDRNGNPDYSETSIVFHDETSVLYENSGIRKAILLSRYADLMKNWTIDEREHAHLSYPWNPCVDDEEGIIVPPALGQWERQSLPLMISECYRVLFEEFLDYFRYEMGILYDETLSQEVDIMEKLIHY